MSKQRRMLRNRLEYALYLSARGVVSRVRPTTGARLGAVLGDLFMMVGGSRRRIINFNLRLAFPELTDDERRLLARRVARHFVRVTLDAMRIQRLTPQELKSGVEVQGREHVEAALALGRGLFLLSAHVGSWEVAGLVGGLLTPGGIAVIYRPLDNPLLDRELQRLRGRFGNRPLGKRNISREILQELKNGRTVGILIDQRPRDVSLEVPFFGHPAVSHPILARFVRRTRAPVVPMFGLWNGPGNYTVRFGPPVVVDDLTPEEREDGPLTARFMAIAEAVIRERPEQWLWFHDRWRNLRTALPPLG